MLPPDSRAILVQQLKPPAGYRLDAAVATTFALDLTATLIPALALSAYSMPGANPDPVTTLDALRKAADRLDIFCQAGNIGVPTQAPELCAFLEPMVHEVKKSRGLFHPKVWLSKYSHDELEPVFKLLVLSRNLTLDNTWDLIVSLESASLANKAAPGNRPLVDFIMDLPGRTVTSISQRRADRIRRLAREASRVVWAPPAGATQVQFHYLNEGKHQLDLNSKRRLIVSPFINDSGLELLAPNKSDGKRSATVVVSRAEELEKLTPVSAQRITAFVLDSAVGFVDADAESTGEPALGALGSLHAKAYVFETDGQRKPRVLFGSANATDAAFDHNVEFMVEFVGPWKLFGIDAWIGTEDDDPTPFRSMLEEYEPTGGAEPDQHEEAIWQLENQLRRLACIPHEAKAIPNGEGTFDLAVHAVKYPLKRQYAPTIRPLTRPGTDVPVPAQRAVNLTFSGLKTEEVTGFFVLTLNDAENKLEVSCVVLADLEGEPSDRLDAVIASQLDTPEKFVRFLYLIMSLSDPGAAVKTLGGGNRGFFGDLAAGSGVLEVILKGLAANPSVITEIDRIVEVLKIREQSEASVLPEGFERIWPTVLAAQLLVNEPHR